MPSQQEPGSLKSPAAPAPSNQQAEIRIRSYHSKDFDAVRDLFVDGMIGSYCPGSENEGLRNYVARSLQQDMADIDGTYFGSDGHFWVASTEDEAGEDHIVATIAIQGGKENNRGELRRLSVRREYRRRGIAQQMMRHLEKWASDQGFAAVFLTTGSEMVPAIKLYEEQGYARIKEVPSMSNPSKKTLITFEKLLR